MKHMVDLEGIQTGTSGQASEPLKLRVLSQPEGRAWSPRVQ